MEGLKKVYKNKSPEIVQKNVLAARLGFEYINANYQRKLYCPKEPHEQEQLLLDGSSATLLGAIKAGLSAYLGYPMTPTSSLLHLGAQFQKQNNIFVYQPEDNCCRTNGARY